MIHLDHAATSHPKAPGVAAAVAHWFVEVGVSPDRGDGAACEVARQEVEAARRGVARLCGVATRCVAFTSGTTESLHLLFQSLLRRGDRVVTTAAEHSSVARPLVALRRTLDLDLVIVRCDRHGLVDAADLEAALRAGRTRLLVLTHASNVTGAIQPVEAALRAAREHGALSILDAAQTAGQIPVDVGADFVVGSAHKGLLGPPGLGFVAAREPHPIEPPKPGGSGAARALDVHPSDWPTVLESGTPNTPALFGLAAALRHLDGVDAAARLRDGLAVVDALAAALRAREPSACCLHPDPDQPRLPILSFTLPDLDVAEAGILLDAAGVHVRTGFHCAPWIHAALGTEASGTIRVSPGPGVDADAAAAVAAALAR